jgi:hypothetical protein
MIRAPKQINHATEERILNTVSHLSSGLKGTLTRELRANLNSIEPAQMEDPCVWVSCLQGVAKTLHQEERWSRTDLKKLSTLSRHCQDWLCSVEPE